MGALLESGLVGNIGLKHLKVISSVDSMKAKQDEITADLIRIKDPDTGLFPRVKSLEEWRATHSRITWGAVTALIALAVKQLWDIMTTHL